MFEATWQLAVAVAPRCEELQGGGAPQAPWHAIEYCCPAKHMMGEGAARAVSRDAKAGNDLESDPPAGHPKPPTTVEAKRDGVAETHCNTV